MDSRPCRVLFVDDDKVDQLAFKRLVAEQKLAYETTIAGSVAEARQALGSRDFDIVIADYRLGDGTAFDLIEHIRSTPVVFVTGSGSEEVAVRAMHAGAADYLIKDPERNYLKVLPATVEHALARVRAEEQVRKLTKALEESPAAVVVTDREGHIEYVNPRFTLLTGYDSAEAIGKTPRILKSGAHPPDFYQRMWATILSGRVWRGEVHNRRRDGTLFWAALSISPLRSPTGDVTHFVAVAEDVSDRRKAEEMLRESEENFRALAENANDGILITVDETSHVYANRRIAEMVGLTREQLLTRSLWELAPGPEQQRLKDIHARRLRGEPMPELYETSLLRSDGTSVPVEVTVAATTWRGRPAVMRIIRDIAERVKAQQALRESEEQHRTLVERSNTGIAIIQDGLVRYANPKLLELSGWSSEEVLGRPFVEFVRPDERPKVIRMYQRRMRGQDVPGSYETVFRRKDGSSAYVELNAGVISFEGRPADFVVVHDMTRRREAEAALEEKEARLRRLVDQVPAILWTTDRDLKFTSSVGAGLARLNLVPGQVVGMSLADFFQTKDPDALPIASHRRALAGQSVTYVFEWKGNAYDTDVEPLYDERGNIIGTVGIALDITQLVRAETALQESEENFRQLAANASDGIIIAQPNGAVLYANPRAAVLSGYPAKQLLTMPLHRLIADPAGRAGLARAADDVMHGHPSPTVEITLTRQDRSEVQLEVTTALTTWQGRPAVMHIMRDITERKQAEQALRRERDRAQSYLDVAGGIIVALDRQGVVTLINRAGAAILGHTPEEVVGRSWYDTFVPESTRAAQRAAFERLMLDATGPSEVQFHSENAVLTRDGRERVIAWYDTVVRDDQGRCAGMLSSGYDITDRKEAEAERERLIAELDAYAGTVAHDLNNPLSSVIGFTELLKQNKQLWADEDVRENLVHIEASANRMKNIIAELLVLATVRKTKVVLQPVDMKQVVMAALDRLAFMVREFKPEIILPDVWPKAMGHGPWLEEVWTNYF
ncbi:MAG: PAS domain S-box protein, partial [candidate division WOR-3 bacterium]